MLRAHKKKGQGALEYILLIGGGTLVAMLVMLILFLYAPIGEEVLNANIVEYSKLDLCEAFGPECSLGLIFEVLTFGSNSRYGFAAVNDSDWRDLVLVGVTMELYCGNVLCTYADVAALSNQDTFFRVPVGKNGANPNCSLLQNGTYNCVPCDTRAPNPASCFGISEDFCPDTNPTTPCVNYLDFLSNGFSVPVPHNTPQPGSPYIQLISSRVGGNSPITKINYKFHVRQPNGFSPNVVGVHSGVGMERYASMPYSAAGFSVCQSSTTLSKCTFPTGCWFAPCNNASHNNFCAVSIIPEGDPICVYNTEPPTYAVAPVCVVGPPYYEFNLGPGEGYAMHADMREVFPGSYFVPELTPGLILSITDPAILAGCSTQPSPKLCADLACELSYSTFFNGVQLYTLSANSCSAWNAPVSAITYSSPFVYAGPGMGSCRAEYGISSAMAAAASTGGDFYIGIKHPGPTTQIVQTAYSSTTPRIEGLYAK